MVSFLLCCVLLSSFLLLVSLLLVFLLLACCLVRIPPPMPRTHWTTVRRTRRNPSVKPWPSRTVHVLLVHLLPESTCTFVAWILCRFQNHYSILNPLLFSATSVFFLALCCAVVIVHNGTHCDDTDAFFALFLFFIDLDGTVTSIPAANHPPPP